MPSLRNIALINLTAPSQLDTVMVSVAAQDPAEAKRLGTFFAIVKVNEIPSLLPWIDSIANFLEQTYVQSIQLDPTTSVDRALSTTRQRLKTKLQQIVQETRTVQLDSISYCLGALKGKQLTLTHQGDVQAYVLHQRAAQPNRPTQSHWIHITETPLAKSGAKRVDTLTTPTIVSGTIGPDDTLLVTTESLIDTLGLKRVEQIIGSPSLEGIDRLLERTIRTQGAKVGYGSIILRLPTPGGLPGQQVTESMTHLSTRETSTSSLLSSQGPSLMNRLRTLPEALRRRPQRVQRDVTRPMAERLGTHTGSAVRRVSEAAGHAALLALIVPFRLLSQLITPNGRQQLRDSFTNVFPRTADRIALRLNGWPVSTRRLLTFSLFLGYLFAQSLVFLASRQIEEKEDAAVTAQAQEIQSLLDRAESSLIFGDDEEALRLITEAATALSGLPNDTSTNQQRLDLLNDKIDTLRGRAAREVTIDSLVTVANLRDLTVGDAAGLVTQATGVLAYRRDGTSIASLPASGSATILTPTGGTALLGDGSQESSSRALFLGDTTLTRLDTGTNTYSTVALGADAKPPTAIATYNNRLYVLSPDDRQIWRYQASGSDYNGRAPWVKGSTPLLGNATGLAIDGDVFVLTRDGLISKFSSGEQQPWEAAAPGAVAARRLMTIPGSDVLFAMDAGTNELYHWRKADGKLIAQYQFPSLTKLLDFALSSDGKTTYVTDGVTVATFTTPQ